MTNPDVEFAVRPAAEVPNQPRRGGGEFNLKYPFNKMNVGDVFLVPHDHPAAHSNSPRANPRVYSAASSYGRLNGKKFSVRRQTDGSVRVERTA